MKKHIEMHCLFRLDAQVCRPPKEQPKDQKKCDGAADERKKELATRMSFMQPHPLPVNPLQALWDKIHRFHSIPLGPVAQ